MASIRENIFSISDTSKCRKIFAELVAQLLRLSAITLIFHGIIIFVLIYQPIKVDNSCKNCLPVFMLSASDLAFLIDWKSYRINLFQSFFFSYFSFSFSFSNKQQTASDRWKLSHFDLVNNRLLSRDRNRIVRIGYALFRKFENVNDFVDDQYRSSWIVTWRCSIESISKCDRLLYDHIDLHRSSTSLWATMFSFANGSS